MTRWLTRLFGTFARPRFTEDRRQSAASLIVPTEANPDLERQVRRAQEDLAVRIEALRDELRILAVRHQNEGKHP